MDLLGWIIAARYIAGATVAAIGLVFVAGGGVGMLRFPDVYTRAHAALASDGVGATLVLLGLAIVASDPQVSTRLILLSMLTAAIAPFNVHAVASAAHAGGLAPLSGAYVAPRPGAKPAQAP